MQTGAPAGRVSAAGAAGLQNFERAALLALAVSGWRRALGSHSGAVISRWPAVTSGARRLTLSRHKHDPSGRTVPLRLLQPTS